MDSRRFELYWILAVDHIKNVMLRMMCMLAERVS